MSVLNRFKATVAYASLLSCLVLCLSVSAVAADLPTVKPEEAGFDSEKLAQVRKAMDGFVESNQYAGVTTIVARRGKIVFFESTGWADVAAKRKMTPETIVRIYSMTKPVTSVAVMMLVEEGKIGLDDPLSKHLPEFAGVEVVRNGSNKITNTEAAKRQPTIRDLLRHTSGFTYGIFGNTSVDQAYLQQRLLSDYDVPLSTMVKRLSKIPLLSQPGSRFDYSMSSDVLGRVVEVASEMTLAEFFQKRIFEPLDMRDSGFHVPKSGHDRFASVYTSKLGQLGVLDSLKDKPFQKPRKLYSGGGGLVSTASDYLRFCQMILDGGELQGTRLLKSDTVAQMTKNQLFGSQYPLNIGGFKRPGVGFGLGFSIIAEPIPFASFVPLGEFGWGGLASTHFWISPKHETAVVVLSQYMPFSLRLETAIKPIIYDAITDLPE